MVNDYVGNPLYIGDVVAFNMKEYAGFIRGKITSINEETSEIVISYADNLIINKLDANVIKINSEYGNNTIDIKLNDRQTGYEIIAEYIRKFWNHNNTFETVIVSLATSYDEKEYHYFNEIASPDQNFEIVEFMHDWWEGEKYIKLRGIKTIDELDITGGIYE